MMCSACTDVDGLDLMHVSFRIKRWETHVFKCSQEGGAEDESKVPVGRRKAIN